jgi:GNAT superfamily N-acetyltransferase
VIRIEDDPSPSDLAKLEEEINAFNYETTGHRDGRRLAAFLRSPDDKIEAGISGFTWGGYCKIDFLWVCAERRHTGVGKNLLAAAEHEARARGCDVIILDTHDFQAPRFYERLGYKSVGRQDGCPRNSGQTWYRKDLRPK